MGWLVVELFPNESPEFGKSEAHHSTSDLLNDSFREQSASVL